MLAITFLEFCLFYRIFSFFFVYPLKRIILASKFMKLLPLLQPSFFFLTSCSFITACMLFTLPLCFCQMTIQCAVYHATRLCFLMGETKCSCSLLVNVSVCQFVFLYNCCILQGDSGMKGSFATRVAGSADLYRVSILMS